MNAKQYLLRVRHIDKEINSLLMTIAETRDRLTKVTQSFDGDGAQSTKDPHKFDRLVELEALIEHLRKDPLFDLVERYGITGVINSIPAADAIEELSKRAPLHYV